VQTRILFHCAHKLADESKLMQYHQQLTESIEDQLSLASIHYQRSHYQVGCCLAKGEPCSA
jgi:intraflagellar transport protein 56